MASASATVVAVPFVHRLLDKAMQDIWVRRISCLDFRFQYERRRVLALPVPAQNCAFQNAGSKCWRASVWEVHPVFALYVCNAAAGCSADSNDGWDEVQ